MKSVHFFSSVFFFFIFEMSFGQSFNEILGRPADSSITMSIMFTDQNADVYWEYGTLPGNYSKTTTTNTATVKVPLIIDFAHLLPDTRYYYRTRYRPQGSTGAFLPGNEHSFHTQRASGATFTFDVEADEHLYNYGSPDLYKITLGNEALDNPDFLISLGDIFGDDHDPWAITSKDCDSLHYGYRSYLGTICHSVPFYICLGNHEGEKNYYLDSMPPNNIAVWSTLWRKYYYPNPYPNYFYSGDTLHEGFGIGQPENYYSWTWGNALFIVLDVYRYDCYSPDSNSAKPGDWDWTLGYAQYTWLKNILEKSNAKFKFVFAHHVSGESRGGIVPAKLFEWGGVDKKGKNGFAANRPGWAKPIHQLFKDNGVSVFFQGHDHMFAHEILDGVTYQEVPMAADATYTKGMTANADAYTSDTFNASGHVRVTVTENCVHIDYVRAFLPKDTVSGNNHNREISFSYTIGNCSTGTDNEKQPENVKVYPVPAKERIFVSIPGYNGVHHLTLIDPVGKIVFQSDEKEINVSGLKTGVYFIKINTDEGDYVKKIIINP